MDSHSLVEQTDSTLVPGLTPSASIQARLAMGQHRHRAAGNHFSEKDDPQSANPDNGLIIDLPRDPTGNGPSPGFLPMDLVYIKCLLAQRPRLRWLLAVYLSFCLVFWSSGLFLRLADNVNVLPPRVANGTYCIYLL